MSVKADFLMFRSQKINPDPDSKILFRYDFAVLHVKTVKEKSFFLRIYGPESVFMRF